MWVPRRLRPDLFSSETRRQIVEDCGRGVGHTVTMLCGAAQIADFTDGPVRLLFGNDDVILQYALLFAEIARKMGYERVVVRGDDVLVNGVRFEFRPVNCPSRLCADIVRLGLDAVTYKDKGAERYLRRIGGRRFPPRWRMKG